MTSCDTGCWLAAPSSTAEQCLKPDTSAPGDRPLTCAAQRPSFCLSNFLTAPSNFRASSTLIQVHIFPLSPPSVFSESRLQLCRSATARRCCLTLPLCLLSLRQPSLPLSCLSASANPGCAELLPAGSERSPAGTLLSHPPAGTRLHFQPSTACLGFIMCVCAAAPPAEAGRGGGGRLVARVRTKKKQGDRG